MTVTLAQLKKAAAKVGVVVEREPPGPWGEVVFQLIAPEGKVFAELNSQFVVWTENRPNVGKGDYTSHLDDLSTLEDGDAL